MKGEIKMDFLRNLFGNKQPAATSSSKGSTAATVNPFTTDVVIKSGILLFKCPTCPNTTSVTLQQIDPIIGVSVACSSCKNISHVPGIYKTEPKPPGMKITGSVRVPIAKFADLYFEHPLIQSLINSGQSDLLFDYGLWAFCGACYHQFPATVLWAFSMAHRTGGFVFNARTPDSAIDMNALRDGHCSHCQHKNLIVVVTEIPDYVRNVIMSKKN
jgi:hypothetical protein